MQPSRYVNTCACARMCAYTCICSFGSMLVFKCGAVTHTQIWNPHWSRVPGARLVPYPAPVSPYTICGNGIAQHHIVALSLHACLLSFLRLLRFLGAPAIEPPLAARRVVFGVWATCCTIKRGSQTIIRTAGNPISALCGKSSS